MAIHYELFVRMMLFRSRSAAVGAARVKKMKARDELLEVNIQDYILA